MNFQQSKILLEKINSLHKNISMDGDEMAAIERDLMLSYIRQLYESFLHPTDNGRTSAKQEKVAEFEVVAKSVKAPTPEPPKRTYTPPKIIEIPDSIKELSNEPVAAPPPPKPTPKPTPEPVVVKAPPVAPPPPQPATPEPTAESARIRALFDHRAAKELSEKLGEQPVRDLTRSMAINDRLLYTNDLFGKNSTALNQALELLNKFNNMDEARPFLVNLAQQYDWPDEEREETARAFIKLVRRRYN